MASNIIPPVVTLYNYPHTAYGGGTRIEILEQPQSKFRFRYKSEMAGTHGQLKSENADRSRNIYPTVKLSGWNKGPAVIRLTLYSAGEPQGDRIRHVHILSGRNCDKNTGICEKVVEENDDYTAVFQNLGIIHIAKREAKGLILQRKKEELVQKMISEDRRLTIDRARENITPTQQRQLEESAEEETRQLDLNKVVLRFQAFFYNNEVRKYEPITPPCDSDVIYNLKNASTGELKVCRISQVSASCAGGTEIFMLVEKVKKGNIKVKFVEVDDGEREVWSAYGTFSDADVHHQYAIVFQTPPYRYRNIQSPVKVRVLLERPTDGDISEAREFTYLPESYRGQKRANSFVNSPRPGEAMEVPELYSEGGKKIKIMKEDPLDLHVEQEKKLFPGIQSYQDKQSPMYRVPSPIESIHSPGSLGFYSPGRQDPNSPGGMQYSNNGNFLQVPSPMNQAQFSSPLENQIYDEFSGGSYQYQGQALSPCLPHGTSSQVPEQVPSSNNSFATQVPEFLPAQSVLPSQEVILDQQMNYQDWILAPSQQMSAQQNLNEYNHTMTSGFSQPSLGLQMGDSYDIDDVIKDLVQPAKDMPYDILDALDHISNLSEFGQNSDIAFDYGGKKGKAKKSASADDLSSKLATMKVSDDPDSEKSQQNKTDEKQEGVTRLDVAFRVALSAAEYLQAYAATGDTAFLLNSQRYLLAVQNIHGNNALHTAIHNRNWEAFQKIFKATERIKPQYLLNAQNLHLETPLHVAVKMGEIQMADMLLSLPQCQTNIIDETGNTPFHLAASLRSSGCLNLLLRNKDRERVSLIDLLNAFNYTGETPLLLAVEVGCLESVMLLLQNGVDVHSHDKRRGANPLHIAAIHGHDQIASLLIHKTDIHVDDSMFDGNTALHIAVQEKNQADPYVKNNLRKTKTEDEESDEEEGEEDEGEECYTPFDYAGGDEDIIAILKGDIGSASASVPKKALDSSANLDSGIDIAPQADSSADLSEEQQLCVGDLSSQIKNRLAGLLVGDTWKHLAILLDLDSVIPSLERSSNPPYKLLDCPGIKNVKVKKLQDCLQILSIKCSRILTEI